jgi:hypothetical protein
MKRTLLFAALAATSLLGAGAASAAAFTYHGNLQDSGKPAQGKYDIELTLYSAPSGGTVIGGPLTLYGVTIRDGSFNTEADFGPLTKTFAQAYVGAKVRTAGSGSFTPLAERSVATPDTNTSCPGSWSLDGNAGNPSGSFLGTADSASLTLKTDNTQAATTFVTANGPVPNWLGGLFNEYGGQGAFVGGGGGNSPGDTTNANSAGNFGVVGGGQGNQAGTNSKSYSAVGGGISNKANASYAAIAGGFGNQATSDYASMAGGNQNTASGSASSVGGGVVNTASGAAAVVPGGSHNTASGGSSFAAGAYAVAGADSFVWSDGYQSTAFSSSAANQFDIRATGGVAINGTPANSSVEFTVYAGAADGFGGNADMELLAKGNKGYEITSEVGTSGNDDSILDIARIGPNVGSYTNAFRILPSSGIAVIGPVGSSAITLVPSSATAEIILDAHGSQQSDLGFSITKCATSGCGTSTEFLNFGAAGDLQIFNATAEKPGGGSWTATSDRRIKQDIAPIKDALDTVMKLRPVNFRYTPEYRAMEGGLADKSYAGFIAQEYADVFPTDVISTAKHVPGAPKNDPTILALDPNPALITTVAAVQELAVENIELHKQIDELAARINQLEAGKGH